MRLSALLIAAGILSVIGAELAEAKTPGRSYCFLGRCHRVLTLEETRLRLGRTETIRASFYDECARDRFNPCALTSSGEVFRPAAPDNAASPIYPDGTMLLLFYRETGAAAVVRVNNAGPYHSSRLIDVSAATAESLGFRRRGLADIEVRVIAAPRAEEASYRRLRRYWPVHGPIGQHASIAEAHEALVAVSELPRVPARPDAAQLVAMPMTVISAAPPAEDEEIQAAALIRVVDQAAPDAGAVAVNPSGPAALAPVAASRPDVLRANDLPEREIIVAAIAAAPSRGLLTELRARARHGLRPARLPDVGLGVAVAWLRETALHLALNARSAARARVAPRAAARLADLSGANAAIRPISRR